MAVIKESVEETRAKAVKFLGSLRGAYIVGRALYETYQHIKDEEPSDASDMQYLGENLFSIGWLSAQTVSRHQVKASKKSKLGKRK